MKRHIAFTGIVGLLFLFFLSCSEEPNATGINIIPDTLHIESIVSPSTAETTILIRIGGNSSTLLTGKRGNYEARTLMEFTFPTALGSTFIIDSAALNLNVNYRFVDSSGELGFQAHNMTRTWSGSTFTWDSVASSYEPLASGSYLKNITPQDTILSFKLDTALIRLWWQARSGSTMLIPSPSSAIVAGFSNMFISLSSDFRPELVISYHDAADTSDTTLTIERRAIRALFVATDDLSAPPTGTFVQGGVSRRTILNFDSLTIPPLASITEAILEVAVDNGNSLTNSFTRDSIYVHLLRETTPPYDSLALQVICTPVTEAGQKYFRGDIRPIVQQWVRGEPNLGVLLRTFGEFTSLDKFTLYNSTGPVLLRPKIKITYTLLPQ